MPAPKPAPGRATLEMVASEACGTDVHLYHGRLAGVPYPIVPGYVSVGRLVTFYDVFGTCGACWLCLVAKAATRCPHRRVCGITTGLDEGLLGGWAERIELKPGVRVLPLREDAAPPGRHA